MFGVGLPQQGISAGRPPIVPTTGRTATSQAKGRLQADGDAEPVQQKSKVPVLETHLVNQLSKEEQDALSSKLQDATDADKKVSSLPCSYSLLLEDRLLCTFCIS